MIPTEDVINYIETDDEDGLRELYAGDSENRFLLMTIYMQSDETFTLLDNGEYAMSSLNMIHFAVLKKATKVLSCIINLFILQSLSTLQAPPVINCKNSVPN